MKVGIRVACAVCGRDKAPRGRSVPDASHESWCTWDKCVGYNLPPDVGSLWPGESEEDFGYPVPTWGTKEVAAPPTTKEPK